MRQLQSAVLCLSAAGFHRMAYQDWGPAESAHPPVVCVHGLTRNARDFDPLARALAGRGRRVVCPDVVGRGQSDWLSDADSYGYPQYLGDMTTLVARVGAERVDWIGTSMGGLIGMLIAARRGSPIRRLVMNDIGPFIAESALEVIRDRAAESRSFATLDAFEAWLREAYAAFGRLTDAQWRHLAEHGVRALEDGRLARAHDPAIARPLLAQPLTDIALWSVWDQITCPVLVLRGADSDLLTQETAEEMARRGPRAKVVEIPGCGHAPALMAEDQIALVADWLATT